MRSLTRCVHFPAAPGDPHRPVATPIYQTATFAQPGALACGPYDYSRSGNPTRAVLEEQLARLEGGRQAFAVSSGMAALALLLRLQQGHVLAGQDLYGGTHRLLGRHDASFVDFRDLDSVRACIRPDTWLLLVESPTNPLLHRADLAALAKLAHRHVCLLAVDNSLMSPLRQTPLALGADIVVHSATKFLGGHADLTAGALIVREQGLAERIAWLQNAEGCGLGPFDCFLLLRGLKTLGVRIRAQDQSARRIEALLRRHPAVSRVHAAGGSVLSFETGSVQCSQRVVEATRLFTIAVSFGSVGSTISLPCAMSHASIPPEQRVLPEDLVRLSVGIEDPSDLEEDLVAALGTSRRPQSSEVLAQPIRPAMGS